MANSLLEAYDKLTITVSAFDSFAEMIGEHPGISDKTANRLSCLMMLLMRDLKAAADDIGNYMTKEKS